MLHPSRRWLVSLPVLAVGALAVGLFNLQGASAKGGRLESHELVVNFVRDGKQYTLDADFLVLNDGRGHRDQDVQAAKDDLVAKLSQTAGTTSLSTSAYVLSGFSWASHQASWTYNAAGKPSSVSGELPVIQASASTWSNAGANFSFSGGSTTGAGTGACSGSADGQNTIGWVQQSGSVLAVTCSLYSGSNETEFDMQISPSWSWTTSNTSVNIDLQSVVTHELGHAAGLGHSSDASAVMYASYQAGTLKRALTQDDINGLVAIYGTGSTATTTPPPTTTTAPAKAAMSSPAPGSTLSGASATFSWTAGSQALEYFLYVGTSAGSNNVYGQSTGLNRSATLSGLPTQGATLYVRLWTRFSTGWQYNDYTYTEAGSSTPASAKAALLTPAPGSSISGGSATFSWSAGSGASQYFLYLGTTPGSNNLYGQSTGLNRSITLSGLPRNGTTIYVRLWTQLPTGWQYNDYSFPSY